MNKLQFGGLFCGHYIKRASPEGSQWLWIPKTPKPPVPVPCSGWSWGPRRAEIRVGDAEGSCADGFLALWRKAVSTERNCRNCKGLPCSALCFFVSEKMTACLENHPQDLATSLQSCYSDSEWTGEGFWFLCVSDLWAWDVAFSIPWSSLFLFILLFWRCSPKKRRAGLCTSFPQHNITQKFSQRNRT